MLGPWPWVTLYPKLRWDGERGVLGEGGGLMLLLFSSLHSAAWKQGKCKHHNSEPPKKTRDSGSGFGTNLKDFT